MKLIVDQTRLDVTRIVFKVSNRPVGRLDIREASDRLEIWSFQIEEVHRSKGYGRMAIKEIIKLYKHKKLWLYVFKDNSNAVSIYRKCGFVEQNDSPEKQTYSMIRLPDPQS